jgi:hypothetical protein
MRMFEYQGSELFRKNFCAACYSGAYTLQPPKSFGKICFEGSMP